MDILAIETSCDETAVSVVRNGRRVLAHVVASQIPLHARYGGVVPEVAARAHVEAMLPTVDAALRESGTTLEKIDAIAAVSGIGLAPSLLVGLTTGRAFAFAANKPFVAVHHIAGHVYANWLAEKPEAPTPKFPAMVLTVSGGHTELILMRGHFDFVPIGQTRDDAVGEVFDKVASMLGLPYPGGPAVSKEAEKGNPTAFVFPRPMLREDHFDFSFSGLKTAILYQVQALQKAEPNDWKKHIPNICASFQAAACDVLVQKTIRAAREYDAQSVLLTGGVAANKQLREALEKTVVAELPETIFFMPNLRYTTDNASMIGAAAFFQQQVKGYDDWHTTTVDTNKTLI